MNTSDIDDLGVLRNAIITLKKASCDFSTAGPDVYMTESAIEVVSVDKLKQNFKAQRLPECCEEPKSVDALYFAGNGAPTLIEFKNGRISGKEAYGLRRKAYDSLLMLCECFNMHISYTRENMGYIVVYNEVKNPKDNELAQCDGGFQTRSDSLDSDEFESIASAVFGFAREPRIRFNLHGLQGYCFKSVRTYTCQEFQKLFLDCLDDSRMEPV